MFAQYTICIEKKTLIVLLRDNRSFFNMYFLNFFRYSVVMIDKNCVPCTHRSSVVNNSVVFNSSTVNI